MRYGHGPEVLRDLTFRLTPGSFHFLTGPSGAGKTTLLKLMYLAQRPSRGEIEMFGQDIGKTRRRDLPPLRRRIGVVFQDFRLLDHLTALENVALPLRIAGARRERIEAHVSELLAWVGLAGQINAKPPTLSDGEKAAGRHRPRRHWPTKSSAGRRADRQHRPCPRSAHSAFVRGTQQDRHDGGHRHP